MAESKPKITSGGKGPISFVTVGRPPLTQLPERTQQATELLSRAFSSDPVIIYLLNVLPASKQLSYRRSLFDVLLTAGGLNGAAFNEADGWQSCAVLMHPGQRVDNPFTLVQSGFFSVLWNLGLKGCAVGTPSRTRHLLSVHELISRDLNPCSKCARRRLVSYRGLTQLRSECC